jgi:hypothetical protein
MALLSEIVIKDTIYLYLRGSALVGAVTGKMYKDSRPSNSKVEDIVISVVASDTDQIQQFSVNVKVFVPDTQRQNDMIEDTPRLRQLAGLCLPLLKSAAFSCFKMRLKKQRIYQKEGEIPFHVISNTLEVKSCSEE